MHQANSICIGRTPLVYPAVIVLGATRFRLFLFPVMLRSVCSARGKKLRYNSTVMFLKESQGEGEDQ
jgi:hypothetical protein